MAYAERKELRYEKRGPTAYLTLNRPEAMNALKVGMEKSKFQGRQDTMKLIEALEGLQMKLSDDFPTGDKLLRKEDHQALQEMYVFRIKKDAKDYDLLDLVGTISPDEMKIPIRNKRQ